MAVHSIELCAGVGMLGEGVRAGLEFLGIDHRTICYVEREAAAAGQLVTLMEAGALDPAPVWDDLLTFDGRQFRGKVDCIIAGFPCQDLSIAGRRAGLNGSRSGLFFRVLDIADDSGARFLVLENVSGIASATASVVDEEEGELEERAASRVMGELADRGWDSEWITLSASDVGASHGRARWFCLAWRMDDAQRQQLSGERVHARSRNAGGGETNAIGAGESLGDPNSARRPQAWSGHSQHAGKQPEPGCCEVANAESLGQRSWRTKSGGQQRQAHAAECSCAVANTRRSNARRIQSQRISRSGSSPEHIPGGTAMADSNGGRSARIGRSEQTGTYERHDAMADSRLTRLQGREQCRACTCDRGGAGSTWIN